MDVLEEHAGLQDLAPRVALEITERAALGSVEDTKKRIVFKSEAVRSHSTIASARSRQFDQSAGTEIDAARPVWTR